MLSRLPPCGPGWMEEISPRFGAGATPIWPKKQFKETPPRVLGMRLAIRRLRRLRFAPSPSFAAIPHGILAVRLAKSMGITIVPGSSNSGRFPSAPFPRRMAFHPQSTHGSAVRISTLSTSPGSAPCTATGPVMTCGPGAPQWGTGQWVLSRQPGCVPSSAPHRFAQMDRSSRGTSHSSIGIPPGSPETVHRCTTSPLFTSATAGYRALHLAMRTSGTGRETAFSSGLRRRVGVGSVERSRSGRSSNSQGTTTTTR